MPRLVVAIFFILHAALAQFSFDCNFNEIHSFDTDVYACLVKNDLPHVDTFSIREVTGKHLDSRGAQDVIAVVVTEKTLFRIPQGMHLKFPEMKEIKIHRTPMRRLRAGDLVTHFKQRLTKFALTSSKLEVVEMDTFSGFEALVTVDLQGNSIYFFDSTAFAGATLLSTLDISGNMCTEITTNTPLTKASDASSVIELIDKIKMSSCGSIQDPLAALTSTLDERENLGVKIFTLTAEFSADLLAQTNEISSLTAKALVLNTELTICTGERTILRDKVECLSSELSATEELSMKNEDLSMELESCNMKVEKLQEVTKSFEDELVALQIEAEKCLIVNGTCRFIEDVSLGYACVAHNVEVKSESDKIKWTGEHLRNFTDKAVVGVVMRGLPVNFIPDGIGGTFGSLKSLVVTSCALKQVKKTDFDGLEGLNSLTITKNAIASIPGGVFDSLVRLTHLDLSENSISSLPSKAFAKLTNLEHLILSDNDLMSLKYDLIPSNGKIRTFEATNNRIRSLDISFVWRLSKAKSIDFSGNACDYSYDSERDLFGAFYSKILANC